MAIPDITPMIEQLRTQLELLTVGEVAFAAAVPVLAILIRLKLKEFFKRKRRSVNFGTNVLRVITPLISPMLAIILSVIGLAVFRVLNTESLLLLFLLKACVAWLAIQLVYLMSSYQMSGWVMALVIIPLTLLQMFDLWDITVEALSSITFHIASAKFNAYVIIKGVVVLIILQWLASGMIGLFDARLRRVQNMRASNRILVIKLFQIVLYCLIALFGMQMLGINLSVLGVVGGAVGVGIGFGLQKIASNFISGIILLFEKSIEIGDLIEFADGTQGFVRQNFARYTLIETPDGREIMVPNEEFISQRVTSWTHSTPRARVEISVQISYDSDVVLARQLMLDLAAAHPKALPTMPPDCIVTTFADSGITLLLHFWIADIRDGRGGPKSDVMLSILAAFKEHGINIPYPQRVVQHIGLPPGSEGIAGASA